MDRKEVEISFTVEEAKYLIGIYTKEYEDWKKFGTKFEEDVQILKKAINDLSNEKLVIRESKYLNFLYSIFVSQQILICTLLMQKEIIIFLNNLSDKYRYAFRELKEVAEDEEI